MGSSTVMTDWFNGNQKISDGAVKVYGVIGDGIVAGGSIELQDKDGTTKFKVGPNQDCSSNGLFRVPVAFSNGCYVKYSGTGNYSVIYEFATPGVNTTLEGLLGIGGLTFFKDYTDSKPLRADYSLGSPNATFTVSRDATHPATWVDKNGIIQKTTASNMPRFQKGYYDTTGFHTQKGLMIEAAGTNYVLDGTCYTDTNADGVADSWISSHDCTTAPTYSLVDVKSQFNVGTTVNAQRSVYNTNVADVNKTLNIRSTYTGDGTFADNDVITLSMWIKGSIVGADLRLQVLQYDVNEVGGSSSSGSNIASNISSTEFRKFSYSVTLTDDDVSQIQVGVNMYPMDSGDSADIQIACIQVEKSPYATSFIPTTTAALTRNVENLKYPVSNNVSQQDETIVAKVVPYWSDCGTSSKYVFSTDTKNKLIRIDPSSSTKDFIYKPNSTDHTSIVAISTTDITIYTSTIICGIGQHSSPYARIIKDGVSEGTYTTGDWTNPAFSAFLNIGSNNVGAGNTEQWNGVIQSIAFFNRALSAPEVVTATNLLS